MNYRRLLNGYRAQCRRGKSHYQIVLEALAKSSRNPSFASTLMKTSLRRHGLLNDVRAKTTLSPSLGSTLNLGHDLVLSDRFFVSLTDKELWETYRSMFANKIQTVIDDANRICRHEFDLLGSAPICLGHPIDWHIDPVTGYRWPKKLYSELKNARTIPNGSDVKLPWELSRMQHLPTLGKAYRLTKNERYAEEITQQITHWLDENPCPYGVNWLCPMDVAIRIMNIIWAYLLIEDSPAVRGDFKTRLACSILQHGQYILFNLEYGLRDDGSITNGNHYLANIVGLLHLGLLCPGINKADEWRSVGIKALVEEMDRQVHPDGVNFESSISYHRLVLELFTAGALLCRANGITLPARFWERLERMFEFVLYATRPDGRIPTVGDADDGRLFILSDYGNWDRRDFRYLLSIGAVLFDREDMKAHSGGFSEDAFWLLGPSGMNAFAALNTTGSDLESKAFPDSGLYVMRQSNRYLLACCGEVGTDGVGNHKHNDLLSFELYAGDKPFIIDPGAYVYTRSPKWRNTFRSTAFHNTVVIDEQQQNRFEPSEIFKMSSDANVVLLDWISTPKLDRLDAEHTGYARLDYPVRHRRTFLFHKAKGMWEIIDVLTGRNEHTADWYFHFDTGIGLESTRNGTFRTLCEGTTLQITVHSEILLTFKIEDGWVSRQYGQKLPAKILHMTGRFNAQCRTHLTMCIVSKLDSKFATTPTVNQIE